MRSPRYCPCCVRTSPRSFIPQCSFIRSPCACSPLHAHSYSPRSPRTCSPSFVPSLVFVCMPSDSFVIPALASCSFVRHTRLYPPHSPCTCSRSFVHPRCSPRTAIAAAAAAVRTPSLAPWFVCARPVLVLLSVVPHL